MLFSTTQNRPRGTCPTDLNPKRKSAQKDEITYAVFCPFYEVEWITLQMVR